MGTADASRSGPRVVDKHGRHESPPPRQDMGLNVIFRQSTQPCFQLTQWPQLKIPPRPKKHFPIGQHYISHICKTVDRTPQSANKITNDSFLINRGSKSSMSSQSDDRLLSRNLWAEPGREKNTVYIQLQNQEVNLEAEELFGARTWHFCPNLMGQVRLP